VRLFPAIGTAVVASFTLAGCTESPSDHAAPHPSADHGDASSQNEDLSELSRKAVGAIRKHAELHPEYGGVTDLEPTRIVRGEAYSSNSGKDYTGKLIVFWTKPFKPQGGGYEYVFSVDRGSLSVELVRRALGR
jgi:hypothetical protein